jgi:hypothetical protein
LEYLDRECTFESINADSTPLLLDQEIIQIILNVLERKKKKLSYGRALFSIRQFKEIKRIKGICKSIKRGTEFNLRSLARDDAKSKGKKK